MALTGTLNDLGIVDLVQLPVASKKTGVLIVAGVEHEARLFYDRGALQHIVCGEDQGLEGMVRLMGWVEGEFEFRPGVTTAQKSVEKPLQELLESAAAIQKDRNTREETQHAGDSLLVEGKGNGNRIILRALSAAARQLEYVEHAAIYKRSGELVCVWNKETPNDSLVELFAEVNEIFDTHPRPGLQKIYLTDSNGTNIATLISDSLVLLLSANDLSSLGMVSVASSKIVSAVLALLE